MKFDLCKELGIRYPILGGAMTGVSVVVLPAMTSLWGAVGR